MAFTSWSALRTSLKDAMQDHLDNDKALVGMVTINGRQLQYNGLKSIMELIDYTYTQEAMENTGNPSKRRSFGKFRRVF